MAIWQVCFRLICIGNYNDDLLQKCVLKEESISMLSEELPCEKSWSDDIRLFGKTDSTCVEIFYDNEAIDDILVRIDIRQVCEKQILTILRFATANKLQILCNEEKMEPSWNAILKIIRSSNAYQYLSDPEEFLRKMGQRK